MNEFTAATWWAWAFFRWNSNRGENRQTLGLTGHEVFEIDGVADAGAAKGSKYPRTICRRKENHFFRHRPRGHPGRSFLLPARRHFAVRYAADVGVVRSMPHLR